MHPVFLGRRPRAPPGSANPPGPVCSAPSPRSPLPGSVRGTYRLQGGTSVQRGAEPAGLGARSLLLVVLPVHILPEIDLEAGKAQPRQPGSEVGASGGEPGSAPAPPPAAATAPACRGELPKPPCWALPSFWLPHTGFFILFCPLEATPKAAKTLSPAAGTAWCPQPLPQQGRGKREPRGLPAPETTRAGRQELRGRLSHREGLPQDGGAGA